MNIVSSIILIILFLFLFTAAEVTLHNQYYYWIEAIESFPLIIFTHEKKQLEQIQNTLSNEEIVAETVLERNHEVLDSITRRYHLESLEEVVDTSDLPHVLEVNFDGKSFTLNKYDNLLNKIDALLTTQGTAVCLRDRFSGAYSQRQRQLLFYRIYQVGSFLILFFIVYLADRKYLYITDTYWQIYIKAGGRKNRYLNYLKTFLVRFMLPFLLFAAAFFYTGKQIFPEYTFTLHIWLIMAGLMIIANQAAWVRNSCF